MKLQEKFNSIFSISKSKYRSFNKMLWEDSLLKCDYVPYEYTNEFLDYELSYEGQTKLVEDFSVILFNDNHPVGLFSISYFFDNEEHKLKIFSPIYFSSVSLNQISEFNKELVSSLVDISKIFSIKLHFIDPFFNSKFLSNFHVHLLQYKYKLILTPKIILNLSNDISTIRMNFRKSYKSLINNGNKLFSVEFLVGDDTELWDEFKKFHIKISGKQTRSDETWDLNYLAILNGRAFLAYIKHNNELVGAAYFLYSKSEAVYGVGVYERELSNLPISHSIQYSAICKLKELNIQNYCLGISLFANEDNFISKEINISHFKRGFGGNHSYSYEFIINYE